MKVRAYKECDICNNVVARKNTFLYSTLLDYVTIKEKVLGYEGEYSQDIHICKDCWNKVMQCLRTNVFPYEITLEDDD